MTSLIILKDELFGFYKSRVMLILWLVLPLFSLTLHFWRPVVDSNTPFSLIIGNIIASVGSTLGAMMLTVQIIHERTLNVYDLFLYRPVKRHHLLLAKYVSVFICLSIAAGFALGVGFLIDLVYHKLFIGTVFKQAIISFMISLSTISISCSAGVLIGIITSNVLIGIILILFTSSNISLLLGILPNVLKINNPIIFSFSTGIVFTLVFLLIANYWFAKKEAN